MQTPRTNRRPIVGVMGSGQEEHEERAKPLGHWLAQRGVHLLTGGGAGVMTSVSRAFAEVEDREGSIIGVLPGTPAKDGYPNPYVDIPIQTHLPYSGERGADPLSRNHINILSSDVIIALPGGHGTASEVKLALTYDRPLVAYLRTPIEIPNLPPEVAIERELDAVIRFVEMQLGDC